MKLYDYFRSGAAYRTRIALNLKEVEYEQISVNLTKGGGEQFEAVYSDINPQSLVPTLMDGEVKIFQSMAIMEYLEEKFPAPSLLPSDPSSRARVRHPGWRKVLHKNPVISYEFLIKNHRQQYGFGQQQR